MDSSRARPDVVATQARLTSVRDTPRPCQSTAAIPANLRWNSTEPSRAASLDPGHTFTEGGQRRTWNPAGQFGPNVEAVLLTLREAVDRKEFNHFMSQLPVEFTRLLRHL